MFEAFFLLNIADHLVDLNTPFWIEKKVNEESVSALLIRWMEGGLHLSTISQAYSYFFLSDILTLLASFDFQKLAHA